MQTHHYLRNQMLKVQGGGNTKLDLIDYPSSRKEDWGIKTSEREKKVAQALFGTVSDGLPGAEIVKEMADEVVDTLHGSVDRKWH